MIWLWVEVSLLASAECVLTSFVVCLIASGQQASVATPSFVLKGGHLLNIVMHDNRVTHIAKEIIDD